MVCSVVASSALVGALSTSASAAPKSGTQYITTVAGGGTDATPSNGMPSLSATLGSPLSAVFDSHGNVVFADQSNNVIRVAATSTGSFYGRAMVAGYSYTIAGDGNPDGGDGPWGTTAPATEVEFNDPNGVAVDPLTGDVAITDTLNNAVRLLAEANGTRFGVSMTAGRIYTVAGEGGSISNGEQASSAGLASPDGIAFDAHGDLVIADTFNDDVRFLPAQSGTYFGQVMQAGSIYVIAGNTINGYSGDGGPAVSAELAMDSFNGLAVDPRGDVVVADPDNNVVRLVAAAGGTAFGQTVKAGDIYTIAGNVNATAIGNKKPAIKAELITPQGIAVDAAGNLFISDSGDNMVRFVAAAKGTYGRIRVKAGDIYTIAGNATATAIGNGGPATAAALNDPSDVNVGPSGHLVVVDNGDNIIREVTDTSTAAPTVAVVKPASGPTSGDRKVTIRGSGLSSVKAVLFGSQETTNITVKSDKKIVAFSPAASVGSVIVRVISPMGVSPASSTDSYTYVVKAARHRHSARHRR